MQRYIIKSQSGISGLELQSDAPIPQLTGPYDVRSRACGREDTDSEI